MPLWPEPSPVLPAEMLACIPEGAELETDQAPNDLTRAVPARLSPRRWAARAGGRRRFVRDPRRPVRLPRRTLGLRQEHAAADAGGAPADKLRRHRGRRQGDFRPRPRARRGLPKGQRLSLDARDRQCRVWPEMPPRASSRAEGDRPLVSPASEPLTRRARLAARTLRRHVEAGR